MADAFNAPLTALYQIMYVNTLFMLPSINPSIALMNTKCQTRVGTGSTLLRVQTNVGQTAMVPVVGISVPDANTDIPLYNRWVGTQQYVTQTKLSDQQRAFTQEWPVGQFIMSQINASLKQQENMFLQGAFGISLVGGNTTTTGSTPIAFPVQNVVGVDGTIWNPNSTVLYPGTGINQPFTTDKIRRVKELMAKNYTAFSYGSTQPFCSVDPAGNRQIGSEVVLTNSMFSNQWTGDNGSLSQGYVEGYLGVTLMQSNELPSAYSVNPLFDPGNTGLKIALLWFTEGMAKGIWEPPTPKVFLNQIPTYNETIISLRLSEGYTRTMEERVYGVVYDPSIA